MPAICRGDGVDRDNVHCSLPYRDQCSTTVFVNGTGISSKGDLNTSHVLPGAPCPPHTAPIALGSTTVFADTKGVGRIGDTISGCTSVASGSANVFAGG